MPTPPRKSRAFKIYAAPVALLLIAGVLAPSPAMAERAPQGQTVQTNFRFDRNAPAETIYANLARKVQRLCNRPAPSPSYMRKHDAACMAAAMNDAVARIGQIGRTDVAELHARNG